jgi:hypothetical protein
VCVCVRARARARPPPSLASAAPTTTPPPLFPNPQDEDAYAELNRFKAALHAMYAARGEGVVFLETALLPGGRAAPWRHAAVHVVPMEAALFDDAHLFFRKAIEEEGEWATNKRLIETAGKGLRGAIPRGFSYFHVAWAGGGFVHPIENEAKFPEEWGLDVAAGMLGQAPARFGRREGAAARTPQAEHDAVREFVKGWAPFDFTAKL